LKWVLDNIDEAFKLFVGEFTSALVHINVGLLAAQVGITTTHTLDGCQGEHNLLLAFNIGVEKTQNVLELTRF
jgi:hypothetical protein